MCGINGFINNNIKQLEEYIKKMNGYLAHRGPDGAGLLIGEGYAFGHTRLAIVDVKNHEADQPMTYKNLAITYNGEIYNFHEIREDLKNIGYEFKTHCDTEVILKGFHAWGIDILNRINGQFAFAIINTSTCEALLVRDRAGKKPLYYSFNNGELRFSSLPETLYFDYSFQPDETTIASALLHRIVFVHGEEPLEKSYYKNIFEIQAGEYISFKKGKVSHHQYYNFPIKDFLPKPSLDNCINELKIKVTESIKRRIPEEVSLGVALSGGLDSSIVTAVAAKNSPHHITASCISYSLQTDNSDFEHAKLLADSYENIELFRAEVTPDNFLEDIEGFVDVMGPHDSISELAMFRNYKTLKDKGAKVILIGEGADELHWGYWFSYPGLFQDQNICKSAESLFNYIQPNIEYVKFLMSNRAQKNINFEEVISYIPSIYDSFDTSDATKKMMGVYTKVQLEFLNRANDRLGMYYSLEPRSPYQDVEAIELACRIPPEYQIAHNTEKFVLREAFKDLLPPAILHRRKAPLPPASHIEYHRVIAQAFKEWMQKVDNTFWDSFNKDAFSLMYKNFISKINHLAHSVDNLEAAGSSLVRRRSMSIKFNFLSGDEMRTNDIFQLLTLMIWFTRRKTYALSKLKT